jgi:hypothetical protein
MLSQEKRIIHDMRGFRSANWVEARPGRDWRRRKGSAPVAWPAAWGKRQSGRELLGAAVTTHPAEVAAVAIRATVQQMKRRMAYTVRHLNGGFVFQCFVIQPVYRA